MPVPSFWRRMERRYKSGATHQFLLHGNIDDYIWDDVYGYLPTKDFLMEQMNRLGCNSVLSYSRSEGIIFPNLGVRDAYQKVMGLARIDDEIEPIPEDFPQYNRLNADFKHVGEEGLVRDTQDSLVTLEGLFRRLRADSRVGLIINDVDKLVPNRTILPLSEQITNEYLLDAETLQRWSTDMQIKVRGHMILLLTENPITVAPELLINDGSTIVPFMIPLPGYEERLAYTRHLLNLPVEEGELDLPEEERRLALPLDLPEGVLSEDFARMTHGLTLKDIQSLWIASKRRKMPVSFNMVVLQNRLSIPARSYGKLELMFGEHGLDMVGGLESTIEYMKKNIQAMKDEETKIVPSGILMAGASGTGKTTLLQALDRDMEIHVVRLRDIYSADPHTRSPWDLSRALDIISSLAPVIAVIDNIDRIKDSTTDDPQGRLRNLLIDRLVAFMRDPSLRGKVLWIATSIRPNVIRPVFRKRGVFDEVVPFILPDAKEREDILKKMFARNAIPYDNRINFAVPAGRVEHCTGADLEMLAMRSYQNARRGERDTVTEQDIVKATDEFVPNYEPAMYEYMTLLALRDVNLTALVPASLDAGIRKQIYDNKKPNRAKINQRLRELENQLNLQRRNRVI
ncbi:AAA family ATPase [Candidatus Poribacteria bacterium]